MPSAPRSTTSIASRRRSSSSRDRRIASSPPNQTERMVAALKERGVPVGYFLFDGEQHGFRKAENIKRALDAELYFYAMLILRSGLRF
ncbi:MAG TPA: prolyl oligopeptidase family serine peptidase [Roseiarcus sp.]|nr:prolyl oligopeptidase family serine peptidase [Roseiarcus sp.]